MARVLLAASLLVASALAQYNEPNPPYWPPNVHVLDPDTPGITTQIINQVYQENGGHDPPFHGQWSPSRYALLFKPGNHPVDVNVGYYTSVIGMGVSPRDVQINNVICENGDYLYSGGALNNFWRSAEGFYTKPTLTWTVGVAMLWSVSQASPLRRVVVDGTLELWQYNYGCCAGYSSGGFASDVSISGSLSTGSQQQFFFRNVDVGKWEGGGWNMVNVGLSGDVPASHCGINSTAGPTTTIESTPVIAEKPYIAFVGGKYTLRVPRVEFNKKGATTDYSNADVWDFSTVFVANESTSVDVINAKLASGLHLVLTPGNYNLTGSIQITNPGTVVLGIGFPTLISTTGQPCITVGDIDGVRVAGVLLQAGFVNTPVLLQWGQPGTKFQGSAQNPGFMYDLFVRVGGPTDPFVKQVSADVMIQINSGNVVADNAWLWRADHDVSPPGIVKNSMNPVQHGLLVYGNNVTTYGLAVEHTLNDLVQWYGEGGRVYFYQSELPYDVTQANFGDKGYSSLRVASTVQDFEAYGAGTYCFFRDTSVIVNSGMISESTSPNVKFVNSLSVWLSGLGQISHILNNLGDAATQSHQGNPIFLCNA